MAVDITKLFEELYGESTSSTYANMTPQEQLEEVKAPNYLITKQELISAWDINNCVPLSEHVALESATAIEFVTFRNIWRDTRNGNVPVNIDDEIFQSALVSLTSSGLFSEVTGNKINNLNKKYVSVIEYKNIGDIVKLGHILEAEKRLHITSSLTGIKITGLISSSVTHSGGEENLTGNISGVLSSLRTNLAGDVSSELTGFLDLNVTSATGNVMYGTSTGYVNHRGNGNASFIEGTLSADYSNGIVGLISSTLVGDISGNINIEINSL